MRAAALLLALLVAAVPARANFTQADQGTASGQFLGLAVGARAVGLGEAYSTLVDDGSAVFWNPAGLTQIESNSLTLMHALYLQDTFFDFVGFGQKLSPNVAWGAGIQYFNAGSVAQTDATGTQLGYFHPQEFAGSVSLATELNDPDAGPFEGTALGLTFKYISSTLMANAQTGAVDLGLLSPRMMDDRLRFSVVAQNLLGRLRYLTEDAPLPETYKAGAAFSWDTFKLATEGVLPAQGVPYFAAGGEVTLTAGEEDEEVGGVLRAGWNSKSTTGLDQTLAGWSFGGGIVSRQLDIDYAFSPFGLLGQAHRMSATFRF